MVMVGKTRRKTKVAEQGKENNISVNRTCLVGEKAGHWVVCWADNLAKGEDEDDGGRGLTLMRMREGKDPKVPHLHRGDSGRLRHGLARWLPMYCVQG